MWYPRLPSTKEWTALYSSSTARLLHHFSCCLSHLSSKGTSVTRNYPASYVFLGELMNNSFSSRSILRKNVQSLRLGLLLKLFFLALIGFACYFAIFILWLVNRRLLRWTRNDWWICMPYIRLFLFARWHYQDLVLICMRSCHVVYTSGAKSACRSEIRRYDTTPIHYIYIVL